jgi:hypothetical protein
MKDKFSLGIDGMDYAGPITQSLFMLEKEGLFNEDPLCAGALWVENVDAGILEKVVSLMDADSQFQSSELEKRMDDFAVFLFSVENIKHRSNVPLIEQAIEESAQRYMFACMLEQMCRDGLIKKANGGVPLQMIKYVKIGEEPPE